MSFSLRLLLRKFLSISSERKRGQLNTGRVIRLIKPFDKEYIIEETTSIPVRTMLNSDERTRTGPYFYKWCESAMSRLMLIKETRSPKEHTTVCIARLRHILIKECYGRT